MSADSTEGPLELLPVRILGLPLDVYRRASEHSDELQREFALIREDSTDHVPARLLALINELHDRFGAFAEGPRAALQAGLARGDTEIDLLYEVPRETAGAVVRLGALLDEADDFCRSGDLLTLAAGSETLAFRRWFLGQFVSQLHGEPPAAWPGVMEGTAGG